MTAVKHEWRKHEKELYCPKQQAVQVTVPSMKFLVLDGAIMNVSKKKSLSRFKDVRLESIEDGDCVQILHVGPYDDEPESFMKVDEFCAAHNLQRANDEWHREIYLSDARKVEPAKLKTVLRVQVKSMQF
ncbi:MAG: GyrI-like domain-containing protein [Veillonella sp.]|nr:GyrI-like domain-containing protein [Veillonella sp.]